jgi:catechol 2,3-dioxygenase-like lactoylglutathione lyase family enzyme
VTDAQSGGENHASMDHRSLASMRAHLRIARPVSDPARTADMYCRGLGYHLLGSFEDHAGFDGVMVGDPTADFHFEFTRCRDHPMAPAPTAEDLTVFYVPGTEEWNATCERMSAAGFRAVTSFNPYWDVRGRTFADPDGYRVVIERARWSSVG